MRRASWFLVMSVLVVACGSDDPVATTSSTTAAPSTTTTVATTSTTAEQPLGDEPPAAARMPRSYFAVTADGDLVEVSTETGAVLHDLASDEITGVVLPPAGELLYYETSAGGVHRISYEGGDAEQVILGGDAALSPDGRFLATSDPAGVTFSATNGVTGQVPYPVAARLENGDGSFAGIAWAPDGRHLYAEQDLRDGGTTILVLAFDGSSLTIERELPPPDGEAWSHPAVRSDGALVVEADPVEDRSDDAVAKVLDPATGRLRTTFDLGQRARSMRYDTSGTLLIVVLEDGTLRWYGGGASGVLPHGDGAFVSADW